MYLISWRWKKSRVELTWKTVKRFNDSSDEILSGVAVLQKNLSLLSLNRFPCQFGARFFDSTEKRLFATALLWAIEKKLKGLSSRKSARQCAAVYIFKAASHGKTNAEARYLNI